MVHFIHVLNASDEVVSDPLPVGRRIHFACASTCARREPVYSAISGFADAHIGEREVGIIKCRWSGGRRNRHNVFVTATGRQHRNICELCPSCAGVGRLPQVSAAVTRCVQTVEGVYGHVRLSFSGRTWQSDVWSEGRTRRWRRWSVRGLSAGLFGEPAVIDTRVGRTIRGETIGISDVCITSRIERNRIIFEQVAIAWALPRVSRATAAFETNVLIMNAFCGDLGLAEGGSA